MHRRPPGRPVGKAKEMSDDSVLRAGAREAMKTGNLPKHRPERLWGGPGSGASCAVCGEIVGTDEVELELQFGPAEVPEAANCHVHARCFAAWEHEWKESPNGHSLPPADDEGIMPSRERSTTSEGERG